MVQGPVGGLRHTGRLDSEAGVSGTENYGGTIKHDDPNPDWDDWQRAVVLCQKMRRTDAQIKATSAVIKLPLLSATWTAQPPEHGDEKDQQIADFVNKCLFDDDAMDDSWSFTLSHLLTHLDFGFAVAEIVWTIAEDGTYRLKRLAPRLAKTIRYWYVGRDGKLLAVVQYAPAVDTKLDQTTIASAAPTTVAPRVLTSAAHFQYFTIPAEYALVITNEREGDQYEGTSMLRTVWRNWFFKDQAYRLEGIRLDRWGVGIPVAEIQEGHGLSQAEHEALQEVLRKVRANERAFLIAPPSIRYRILPEGSSSSSGSSGVINWIDHHDAQISRNILAGFLTMGQERGTLGFGSKLTDLFTSNLRGIANGIAGELKKQVVRKICDLNFDMTGRQYPSIVVTDLDLSHLDTLLQALGQLIGTIITPDDDTEDMLRKLLKLPPLPENLKRANQQQQPGAPPGAPGAPPDGGPAAGGAPAGPVVGPDGGVKHAAPPEMDGVLKHQGTPPVGGLKHDSPPPVGGIVHG